VPAEKHGENVVYEEPSYVQTDTRLNAYKPGCVGYFVTLLLLCSIFVCLFIISTGPQFSRPLHARLNCGRESQFVFVQRRTLCNIS